jgi:uncharacterized C2H2 Zn-finger protein
MHKASNCRFMFGFNKAYIRHVNLHFHVILYYINNVIGEQKKYTASFCVLV